MEEHASESREQLLSDILDLAITNQDFRSGLINDPKPAIFDQFGVQIPESYNLRFIERDPDLDALVVLPDFDTGCDELTDDDLDDVCGGTSGGGGDPGW